MKANEFRIGNLVNNKRYGVEPIHGYQIDQFHKDQLRGDFTYTSEFESIPLTEEWLLKLGFEKTNKYWHNGRGSNVHYDLENRYGRQAYGSSDGALFAISAMNIQYVHQLQNLVYALTGEELTVEELA